MLEAIVEAEIAHKAKDFFAQPQNQINVNDKVKWLNPLSLPLTVCFRILWEKKERTNSYSWICFW